MKVNTLSLLTLILTGMLAFVSCRKTETSHQDQLNSNPLEEKFFNSHRTADPTEKALVQFVKRKNDKLHFVEKTVKQIGFPRWDKAMTKKNAPVNGRSTSDSITITYVPFVRDSQNYVNASMLIRTSSSDTSFSYVCDWQYSQKHNSTTSINDSAEYFAIFFMVMNKTVFGHNRFEILDTNLFKKKNQKPLYVTLDSPKTGGRTNSYVNVCQDVTIYYQNCTYQDSPECNPTCDNCWRCTSSFSYQFCWTEYVYDDGGGSTGGGTGGDTGGGGGSGDDGTPPDCTTPTVVRTINFQEGCEPGWEPIVSAPEITRDLHSTTDGDINNNVDGGYDNATYNFYFYTDPWPTVDNVIPKSQFVGISILRENCMDLAKAQIRKKGYQISNLNAPGQTFYTYNENSGVNKTVTENAVSYLLYALQNGIPVIVGVDAHPGSPNHDNTTDHFIVIVGMGTDSNGNFFRFYDNATNWVTNGASDKNKLYYDTATGLIKGNSQASYDDPPNHQYIVTQVRKSKPI